MRIFLAYPDLWMPSMIPFISDFVLFVEILNSAKWPWLPLMTDPFEILNTCVSVKYCNEPVPYTVVLLNTGRLFLSNFDSITLFINCTLFRYLRWVVISSRFSFPHGTRKPREKQDTTASSCAFGIGQARLSFSFHFQNRHLHFLAASIAKLAVSIQSNTTTQQTPTTSPPFPLTRIIRSIKTNLKVRTISFVFCFFFRHSLWLFLPYCRLLGGDFQRTKKKKPTTTRRRRSHEIRASRFKLQRSNLSFCIRPFHALEICSVLLLVGITRAEVFVSWTWCRHHFRNSPIRDKGERTLHVALGTKATGSEHFFSYSDPNRCTMCLAKKKHPEGRQSKKKHVIFVATMVLTDTLLSVDEEENDAKQKHLFS